MLTVFYHFKNDITGKTVRHIIAYKCLCLQIKTAKTRSLCHKPQTFLAIFVNAYNLIAGQGCGIICLPHKILPGLGSGIITKNPIRVSCDPYVSVKIFKYMIDKNILELWNPGEIVGRLIIG